MRFANMSIINDEQKEQLIEMVRERELLWNSDMPNYRNVIKRAKVWEELSRTMDPTGVIDAKKEWELLRQTLNTVRRRNWVAGLSDLPKWKFAELLAFVPDPYVGRSRDDYEPGASTSSQHFNGISATTTSNNKYYKKSRRSQMHDDEDDFLRDLGISPTYPAPSASGSKEETFGLFVSQQLKDLPEYDKEMVIHEIGRVLRDARLKVLNEQNPNHTEQPDYDQQPTASESNITPMLE